MSAKDCLEAIEYLEACVELQERDEDSGTSEHYPHREGLLLAAIVSYARAFIDSRGEPFAAPRLKINIGEVFGHDPKKIELHKLIIQKRHKAAAHSDWEYRSSELKEASRETGVLRRNPDVIYGDGIDIELFRTMAVNMRDHFRAEMYDRDISGSRR